MGYKATYAARGAFAVIVLAGALLGTASPVAALPEPIDAAGSTGFTSTATVTLVGAGDIASCSGSADSKTAAVVAGIAGTVFTAGDNVYPDGSAANYQNCFGPSWGSLKSRMRPVPGNHDYYRHPGAKPYYSYFGRKAGPSGHGYYAYNAGLWRIYALNSECATTSTCYANQLTWLQNDIAANPHTCSLAIWHRPLYSTGPHGNSSRMAQVFKVLYDKGADVVITGHDHMYERYTPIDPSGVPDPVNGIREFVVGTGGASLYAFKTDDPLVEVRDNTTHGVLRLDLSAGSYAWQFLPIAGESFTDSGTGTCH